jgi:hypothetical protein
VTTYYIEKAIMGPAKKCKADTVACQIVATFIYLVIYLIVSIISLFLFIICIIIWAILSLIGLIVETILMLVYVISFGYGGTRRKLPAKWRSFNCHHWIEDDWQEGYDPHTAYLWEEWSPFRTMCKWRFPPEHCLCV